jgi:hypothetical protein
MKIKPDPVRRDDPENGMFYEEEGSKFSRGFVTVDFVCFQCHTDEDTGEGGGGISFTLAEISERATGIHD